MKLKLITLLLLCSIGTINASQLDTLIIKSKSMSKSISNIVILPEAYTTQKAAFPVLYLLHGAGGNYTDWSAKASVIKTYADLYNIIIICPDGGKTSWYFDSPIDKSMAYETYISKELVEAVDNTYNTRANRKGRAITGLSMGGHGAFYLSFKHQDIWGAAGSMSGGLDIRPFPNSWDIAKRLGSYKTNKNIWEENTVFNLVHLLNNNHLKLIFDCGTDDFFYGENKRLHQKLMERNIPHDYIERPGTHDWNYWENAITYQMLFFNSYFKE